MAFRAETAFRTALLAGFGATATPGCGCQVSSCCENQFNDSFAILGPFLSTSAFPEHIRHDEEWQMSYVKHGDQESGGYLPACDLLNLVVQNATVCEAINARPGQLQRGRELKAARRRRRPALGAVRLPGAGHLRASGRWPGAATYSWRTGRPDGCWAQILSDAVVLWDMTCGGDGELRVRAKWVDDASHGEHVSCEGRNYSVEATFSADSWKGVSDSPRWQCLDIPGGDHRIFTYSVGPTPCLSEVATTESPPTSGSLSVGMELCANLVMVAAAAVGVVVAPWSKVPWP